MHWLVSWLLELMQQVLRLPRPAARGGHARPKGWLTWLSQGPTSRRSVSSSAEKNNAFLIVGLGNPGEQYANTRHNVGFEAVDLLARENSLTWGRKLTHKALTAEGHIRGCRVVLCKPMTFMNVSGESVAPIAKKHGIPTSQVLVVFDDIDSDFGDVKVKQKGGHGGHNGMRSILGRFNGDQGFPRVKIGVGRPPGQMQVAAYVLGRFKKDEIATKDLAVREAVEAMESVCGLGLQLALSGKRM